MKKVFGLALSILLSCTIPVYAEDAATEPDADETKESNATEKPPVIRLNTDELKYASKLSHKIRKNWAQIEVDERKDLTITFFVDEDGGVSELKILKSSGSEELDQSGLDAVKQSAPFEQPPETMKPPKKMRLTFVFQKTEKEEAKTESKEEG